MKEIAPNNESEDSFTEDESSLIQENQTKEEIETKKVDKNW